MDLGDKVLLLINAAVVFVSFLGYVNQELPVQVFEKQLTGSYFSVIFLKIYLY